MVDTKTFKKINKYGWIASHVSLLRRGIYNFFRFCHVKSFGGNFFLTKI